jgi:membrane protein implicated in regulation of membrane protease activity
MSVLFQIAVVDPDSAAWARWLRDVMMSWPAQLVILLLFAGLAVLLALHARREWESGLRNRYLIAGLIIIGVFFVAQFLFAGGIVGSVDWPVWPFVVELIVLFALWLYAFVRLMTKARSGKGDDESRARGAALDEVIHQG